MKEKLKILIMTPVGRTDNNEQIDYYPSGWSGNSGKYKCNTFYPYELAYLSSKLKSETEHEIMMIDANYYGVDTDEYVDIVCKTAPDVLIIEVDSIIYNKQVRIIRKLRDMKLQFKLILCGPHPTVFPEQALSDGADYVARREFEESIVNLIKSDFEDNILGIYPNEDAPLVDISKLSLPENDDIKRRNYCRLYGYEYKSVEMFITRGCPYMCNFCVASNIYYGKPNVRIRNVESVINEIKYLKSNIPDLEGIFFNGESNTANRQYVLEICNRLIEEKLNYLKFSCICNYSTLDEELLKKMKDAGFYKVRIGIESFDNENLKTFKKASSNKLMEVLNNCRKVGMKVYGTISVGTVGSSYEKDIFSIDKIKEMHSEGLIQEFQTSINTPLPGTPFYKQCFENGWLNDTNSYDGTGKVMVQFPNYSSEDIQKAFNYATKVKKNIIDINIKKGINYSMYDKIWCKPVYDTTDRKIGEGII